MQSPSCSRAVSAATLASPGALQGQGDTPAQPWRAPQLRDEGPFQTHLLGCWECAQGCAAALAVPPEAHLADPSGMTKWVTWGWLQEQLGFFE